MSLSEVINPRRYRDREWLKFHAELESYSTDKHVFLHTQGEVVRKGYEWTQCIYGLSRLGFIVKDAKALGVGAGREPVIFWLADRIAHVTATDLYGNETWSANEAPSEILGNPNAFCPRSFAIDRVSFMSADGTRLPFEQHTFDFCWSLSSIEHFGGHDAAAKAIREMSRVTKPGGVICVATEYLLLPEYQHPEYFNRKDLEQYIIGGSPDLALVDSMSWELPPQEYLIDSIALWGGVHRRRRHVVLNDGDVQWTSVIVFLRKTGGSDVRSLVARFDRALKLMVQRARLIRNVGSQLGLPLQV
jgi:SAM-dependent methyltransferase